MSDFKQPVCRGSFALGSACGHCERCYSDPHNPMVFQTYIPMQMCGSTRQDLQNLFDGPIPIPGDRVELICYESGDFFVNLKWRVNNR